MPAHRKPLSTLALNGSIKANPARYKDRTEAPSCPEGIGDPPKHLSVARKNIWAEVVSQAPEGLLQSGDRMMLEMLTALIARQRNRRSPITKGEQQLLLQTLSRLGLSPVDRERVTIKPKEKPQEPSPWDEFDA